MNGLTVAQECGSADGRAAERVTGTLLELARRASLKTARYAVKQDVSFKEGAYQSKPLY